MRIYLDNCCYNRIFDDRSNIKNYLEREAVLIIMQKAFEGEFELVGSDILEIEISKIHNPFKRKDISGIYHVLLSDTIFISTDIKERAIEIQKLSNIKAFDSLHLASAEFGADILITTDIKFLRNSQRMKTNIEVKNPIDFVMEVFACDTDD
ncbi:MAG: PIN domain-containing protein [Lachnospiraceae bacterium]|nr:PIN domain-containing protein [Lachnospiraceae bacterium]